jgi:hypothetical protein
MNTVEVTFRHNTRVKLLAKRVADKALKIDLSFEDALKRILKAKPVHKKRKAKRKAK